MPDNQLTPIETEMFEISAETSCLMPEEAEAINEAMTVRTFNRGTILLQPGEWSKECYYILKGCVRRYYLKDGEENTTYFYQEEDSIFNMFNYLQQIPSQYYLACVEDTTMTVLPYDKELELFKRFPRMEHLCRVSTEEEFARYQEEMETYMTSSPEERYLGLIKNRPNLLQRIPQYQLASYLGVKPESLSRIRRRLAMRDRLAS